MSNDNFGRFYSRISNRSIKFGSKKYLLLTLFVFILGFVMATINTLDKNWWQGSTCSLGMQANGTPEFYNYTFIIVGIMLIVFAICLKPQVQSLLSKHILTKVKLKILTILYFIEMITLILIGTIPYGQSDWANKIHVWFGFYVFVNLGIIMFFAFWFFRKFPKKFLITNYILLFIGLVFYYFGNIAKQLPYAIAEMMIITVVLSWIGIVFIQINSLSQQPEKN